jgi:hypothetical protein
MPAKMKDRKCPDCEYCQACSKSRCRLCKAGKTGKISSELTNCFTYEQYQKWKLTRDHGKPISLCD